MVKSTLLASASKFLTKKRYLLFMGNLFFSMKLLPIAWQFYQKQLTKQKMKQKKETATTKASFQISFLTSVSRKRQNNASTVSFSEIKRLVCVGVSVLILSFGKPFLNLRLNFFNGSLIVKENICPFALLFYWHLTIDTLLGFEAG